MTGVQTCALPIYDLIGDIHGYASELKALLAKMDYQVTDGIEHLLKGLEFALPEGSYFLDKNKDKRTDVRAKWWETDSFAYRELAIVPGSEIERIPHDLVDAKRLPGYDGVKPVFLGHYWLKGEPAPLTDHIACLDYSVAGGEGGKLCGYRFGGETRLKKENFVF